MGFNSAFKWLIRSSFSCSFFDSVAVLTPDEEPLSQRVLQTARSSASTINLQYPLLSLTLASGCLRLLPRLPVTSILPFICPSITYFKKAFPTQEVTNPFSLPTTYYM